VSPRTSLALGIAAAICLAASRVHLPGWEPFGDALVGLGGALALMSQKPRAQLEQPDRAPPPP
jgi:hypothetical protein